MSKKNKEHYLNLDKNQLADKGKIKLQYEESCKESAKRYSESKKHEDGCKTSKGFIKDINKKILTGTMVLVLSTTSLTGCNAYGFKYQNNSEGIRYATGTVDNNYIEDCYYLEIYNGTFNDYESYITVKQDDYGKVKYLDVFTLDIIYIEDDEDLEVSKIISIDEYLKDQGIEKDKYDVEFMEELLEEMSKKNNNKVKKLG